MRPLPHFGSERNIAGACVFTRFLGAIELADGVGTNEPGPDVLSFRVLLGAAFQLQRLLTAAKRALYFDVSAFDKRGREISELAENQNAMPLGARFPFIRLFVLPGLFRSHTEHGEISCCCPERFPALQSASVRGTPRTPKPPNSSDRKPVDERIPEFVLPHRPVCFNS